MLNSSQPAEARPPWFWPVIITVCIVVGGAFWLIVPELRTRRQAVACHENIRQIALAIRQYAMDNDERYPPTRIANVVDGKQPWGWADAVAPYAGSSRVFQCPREPTRAQPDPSQSGYTDYWYNANLATVPEDKVAFLPSTILIGEGADGADITSSRYNKTAMPKQWITAADAPPFRHSAGANYAFADGHARWCEPKVLLSPAPKYNVYSFAVR